MSDNKSISSSRSPFDSSSPHGTIIDEVQAVNRFARRDTFRLRLWRLVVSSVLLVTGLAVTISTYSLLEAEEDSDFTTAFEQTARTLAKNALDRARNVRIAQKGYSDDLTAYAQASGQTWPKVLVPHLELIAKRAISLAGAEVGSNSAYVTEAQREDWLNFTVQNWRTWVNDSYIITPGSEAVFPPVGFRDFISVPSPEGFIPDRKRERYLPLWMTSPPTISIVNWNLENTEDYLKVTAVGSILKNESIFTRVRPYAALPAEEHAGFHDIQAEEDHPHSFAFYPIFEKLNDVSSKVVGHISMGIAWDTSLRNLLPEPVKGIHCVIRNNCGDIFTYRIDGLRAFFEGIGDHHQRQYNDLAVTVPLSVQEDTHPDYLTIGDHCIYEMTIYPSDGFKDIHYSSSPKKFAAAVVGTFLLVALVFFIYDVLVQKRNIKLVQKAARSGAIVSSMIPKALQNRFGTKMELFMPSNDVPDTNDGHCGNDDPIADLFLDTTVMFADCVGFTAWASVREPAKVFKLLETMYAEFDKIAHRLGVFKVETVGDCYVAASGIPDPCDNHALVMISFAEAIMSKMRQVANKLVVRLGPDTGDLTLRIGIHTGPVTAGVLRGDRPRVQLFGDTMNTCSRIESASYPGRILLSEQTAVALKHSEYAHCVEKRDDMVLAKGKGAINTYWYVCKKYLAEKETSPVEEDDQYRNKLLVEWNVECMIGLIQQIVERRAKTTNGSSSPRTIASNTIDQKLKQMHGCLLDEVEEVIDLTDTNAQRLTKRQEPGTGTKGSARVELDADIKPQLRAYVVGVATMYNNHSFHNFEHASHVVMAVTKLLSRIVQPLSMMDTMTQDIDVPETYPKDHSYGITADPLTQFACVFTALIHDVDHAGVSNAQLVKEGSALAAHYQNRSVAEQNSLVLAWDLLMHAKFDLLRSTICATENELRRFRAIVLNGVMATDIVDKDLKKLRNSRWDKTFAEVESIAPDKKVDINRKATIVIEHLLQASDVSHTMQHWHVYRRWNERFFVECKVAYEAGRGGDTDPTDSWYEGELGFFDFYVIPLAKKLKDCGVFGKSSDEFLNYALANRTEWQAKGREIVQEMLDSYTFKRPGSRRSF